MLIQPFSDIHNYDLSFRPKKTNSDVLVCVGDFDMGLNVEHWANNIIKEHDKPLIMNFGNHDYWNTSKNSFSLDEWVEQYRMFNTPKLKFMEKETIVIDDVAFIVATGWSDFNNHNLLTMSDAKYLAKDFSKIEYNNKNITPEDIYLLHCQARDFIIQELEKHSDKKCVVVTHYPPSIMCNISFNICAVSYYWCGQMEDIISKYQPALWLSGHMHNSFDQMLGNTRLILNPAGKVVNGVAQLETFRDDLVIEI